MSDGLLMRPSTWRDPFEARWLGLLLQVAKQIDHGQLDVTLPDGSQHHFSGKEPGPKASIQLRNGRAARRFATGGSLGFAESYLDGDWDSPDLTALLELLALNGNAYAEREKGRLWPRMLARMQHVFRSNTKSGSKRNILAHYDLGNSFYRRWLDPSMTYSSAFFAKQDQPLETAQRKKYEHLASSLSLAPDHHLLEIGCGWGGFAEFAAGEIGAKVTAITISDAQHAFAAKRIQAAGLNEKVEVRLQDYREVEEKFDRVASIEMFEAVGERYWPIYFDKVAASLKPNGLAGLQIITIADRYFETYRRGVDFIQRHIFPGGMLPSPKALDRQFRRAGLTKLDEMTFGHDYARTLAVWQSRFLAAWPDISPLGFDERFRRLWHYYLAYCEAGFRSNSTDVCQIALKRA